MGCRLDTSSVSGRYRQAQKAMTRPTARFPADDGTQPRQNGHGGHDVSQDLTGAVAVKHVAHHRATQDRSRAGPDCLEEPQHDERFDGRYQHNADGGENIDHQSPHQHTPAAIAVRQGTVDQLHQTHTQGKQADDHADLTRCGFQRTSNGRQGRNGNIGRHWCQRDQSGNHDANQKDRGAVTVLHRVSRSIRCRNDPATLPTTAPDGPKERPIASVAWNSGVPHWRTRRA